jgi:hypothetical protein
MCNTLCVGYPINVWAGGRVVVVGFCTSVELTSCLRPCLWIMPYEPSVWLELLYLMKGRSGVALTQFSSSGSSIGLRCCS